MHKIENNLFVTEFYVFFPWSAKIIGKGTLFIGKI